MTADTVHDLQVASTCGVRGVILSGTGSSGRGGRTHITEAPGYPGRFTFEEPHSSPLPVLAAIRQILTRPPPSAAGKTTRSRNREPVRVSEKSNISTISVPVQYRLTKLGQVHNIVFAILVSFTLSWAGENVVGSNATVLMVEFLKIVIPYLLNKHVVRSRCGPATFSTAQPCFSD